MQSVKKMKEMKMRGDIKCPACGGENYELIDNSVSYQAPYGPPIVETEKVYKCSICDSEFDYSDLTGDKKESSFKVSERCSIDEMLDNLSKIGYSWAAIERSLELPQRTISRWKNSKDISSIGIALLRIIRTYPWIIQVASEKFNSNSALQIYLQNAIKDLVSISNHYRSFYLNNFTNYSSSQPISFRYFPETQFENFPGIRTETKQLSAPSIMEF